MTREASPDDPEQDSLFYLQAEYCSAKGGLGHYIVGGVDIPFAEINDRLNELRERYPTRTIQLKIIKNWNAGDPCPICKPR